MRIEWSVRVVSGGDRLSTRDFGGFATKRAAYKFAIDARSKTAHTPILRDGHTYVVFAGSRG